MGNFCLLKNNGAPPLKKADSLGREGVRGKAPPSPEGFPSPVQAFPRSLAMRNPVPRIAAIHDMSGFGRTSLTVAIPILSCMGIQVCPMPTAVLSTHTVEFTDYTLCDLTPELGGILDHWERLGLHFDGVYSGFMASPEQMDSAARCIRNCLAPGGLAVVDPVLGDNGILDPQLITRKWWKKCAGSSPAPTSSPRTSPKSPCSSTSRSRPGSRPRKSRAGCAACPQWGLKPWSPQASPCWKAGRHPGRNASVIAYERDEDRFWRIDCAYIPAHSPRHGGVTFSSVLTGSLIRGPQPCPSRWIAPSSSSPSASGPRSGKGCPRAKASCWSASSAACSRPSRPANAGSWTGTAASTPAAPLRRLTWAPLSCSPKGADDSKSRGGGTPRTRPHPSGYGGMGQRIC